MSAVIEQINSGGYTFVEFAASMLIQASVLIVLLFLADLALRRRVRAVFRYWMWLLVLVKLVLPTSLSGSFSIGYWFGDKLGYVDAGRGAYEPEAAGPMMPALPYIDISNVPPAIYPPATSPAPGEVDVGAAQPIAPPSVPPVQIEWQGVVFLVWLAVVTALVLLLVQRAIFVHGLVAQAREASRPMYDALEDCRKGMKVKRRPSLKVSPNAASPAVCGLLRPVILVPNNLSTALGSADLRVVLLHELAHVKRGDLWVNLAQTLLQIVYFYNPLLWLANAVIRRAREQAVDEAVLVAMGEEARRYPETLVSVAKLAFKRPALSLRLIGVVESKSALTARIKRILSRPMPKSAKLGILGLAVIVITAAILLPMAGEKGEIGEGPEREMTLTLGWSGEKAKIPAPVVLPEWGRKTKEFELWKLGTVRREITVFDIDDYKYVAQGHGRKKNVKGELNTVLYSVERYRPNGTLEANTLYFEADGAPTEWRTYNKDGNERIWVVNRPTAGDCKRTVIFYGPDGKETKEWQVSEFEVVYAELVTDPNGRSYFSHYEKELIHSPYPEAFVASLPHSPATGDVRVSAEELIARIIESERGIRDIRLRMTCTIPAPNQTFYEYDWGYEGGKEFYSGIDNTRDSRTNVYRKVKVTRTLDGEKEWQFRNDPKSSRPNGGIIEPNPNFSFSGGIMTFNTLLGFDAKELSRLSLGEALAQAESVSVRDQTESIDGRACYVIEAINLETDPSVHWRYDVRVWIDCGRDYRPLKFEKYRSIPGKNRFKVASRRVDNIKLKQIDGIWLPIEGDRTTFSTNDIHPPEGMTSARFGTLPNDERLEVGVFKLTPMAPTRRLEIDVESIRLNKGIPPKTFTIDFPKGCEVYDEFAGTRYVVGEPSEKDAALSDAELIEQTKELSVGELIDILCDSRLGVNKKKWFAAIHRLVEIGASAVPEIVAEIRRTEKPQTQSKLALTLRAIGDANAVPGLIDALERAGFSSDYGLGEAKTELERFYKTYQMDPEESLGLGRPVREITIALEKLTGHSEGHDHFDAYDSAGNKLGGYTITPEIRDRERQYRREVAEKWRIWWQANKDNIELPQKPPAPPAEPKQPKPEGIEGGILAGPEGAQLTLAIVPNIDGSTHQPSLTKEQYQKYLDYLAEEGPFAGSIRGDSFQWSPIKGDASSFKGLPLSTYKDRTYILLCARAQYVMMPEVEGRWIWGLEKVEATSINGAPAINIWFDEKAAELLGKLTKANIDNHLAVVIDGWVMMAPAVLAEIRKTATVTGDFTAEEARALVEDLQKGMPAVDQQAVEAMRRVAEAAEKLSKGDLQSMGPRHIVENLFVVGPAGNAEKLAWFFRPDSSAAKGITVHDFAQMADAHKTEVLEVYADANDALAVTSNIKGKDGEQEGRLIFYLSKQTGTWLIRDADIGDPQRVQDDVMRFKSKHPNAKLDSSSQAVDSSHAAIPAIIERLRSAEYVRIGKGSALVVEVESRSAEQSSSTAERIVDFRFKGNLTRSDAFTCDKGKRGDFIRSWATGPMSSVRSNGRDDATVQAEPFSDFHRQVGYDFHPETFCRYLHFHLTDLLERMIGQPDITMGVTQDSEGRTRIVTQYKGKTSEEEFVMLFINAADGSRLASWESTSKDSTDNGTDTSLGRLQLNWKKYSGVWYISDARLEWIGVHGGLRSENRTTVTIREFTPNVEIEDKEFTLDGLNIHPGTRVHDSVLDTTYKYAGAKDDSAERLRRLGTALLMYSNDYDDKFPDTIEQAKQFLNANDLKWLVENVRYIGKGKSVNDDPQMPLAYDRTMLEGEQSKGTNLLSISGIVSFRTGEQLEKLGIGRPVSLVWGEEVNGLRAAIEFEPEKEAYTGPVKIDVRFHIQNVSNKQIQFISTTWRQEQRVIVEDQDGKVQNVGSAWYSGETPIERYHLQPGQQVVIDTSAFGVAADSKQAEQLGHPVGHRLVCKPGTYFVRFPLIIPDVKTTSLPEQAEDWKGELETGRHKLVVAAGPGAAMLFPAIGPRVDFGAGSAAADSYPTSEQIRQNWHRFRGPGGSGVSAYTNVPDDWDGQSGRGILWKTKVPGEGYNSPVVWGDRVFLSGGNPNYLNVFCFDALSGSLLWTGDVKRAPPKADEEPFEVMKDTGFAAPTVATDGKRVFAIFATGDMGCFDFNGRNVWTKNLGRPDNVYGYAASLEVYKNQVLIQYDQADEKAGKSVLLALDGASGKPVWQANRPVANSWCSPILVQTERGPEIITASDPWVIAYEPGRGAEIWRAKCLTGDIAPSPMYAAGLVVVLEPYSRIVAVRASGKGDVTKTHVTWSRDEPGPDICSPLSNGELLFALTSDGLLMCFKIADGEKLWEEDLRADCRASPSLVGDKLYLLTEKGVMIIAEAGPQYKELARRQLGEKCYASPAFADGRIYIRGQNNLYCIGNSESISPLPHPAEERALGRKGGESANVDFDELSVKFGGMWIGWQKPEFTIRADGSAQFSMNKGPNDNARYAAW